MWLEIREMEQLYMHFLLEYTKMKTATNIHFQWPCLNALLPAHCPSECKYLMEVHGPLWELLCKLVLSIDYYNIFHQHLHAHHDER